MSKTIHVLLVVILVCCTLSAFGQVQPCRQDTLANVLGTTCSVGNLILSFGTPINAPAVPITFVPVQTGTQAGFKLITNFVDANSGHFIQFGYTPQSAPGFEIRAADTAIDGSVQGAPQSLAFVEALDFQNFPAPIFGIFFNTDAALDNDNNVLIASQPTSHTVLEVPAFTADNANSFFAPFSTQISDFAFGGASATLNSITFLYTLGPVIPAPAPAALAYTNIDLPGFAGTTASAINNSGEIAGSYEDLFGGFHAFLSGKDGTFTTIDFPGAAFTTGQGVNNHEDVVGTFSDQLGNTHGYLFSQGSFTQIDVPDSLFTFLITINDRGQIVGQYESADQGIHGFLFENGQFTTIDQGPGVGLFASSEAVSINDRGDIFGDFFDPNTFRGYIKHGDAFDQFNVPGQGLLFAGGINARGEFVGDYEDIAGARHGFVRTGGSFLTMDFPGGHNTFPLSINAEGTIVGVYEDSDRVFHSFLAQPGDDHGNNGTNAQPTTSAMQHSANELVCGSDEWRERVKHSRAALGCKNSH